MWQSFRNIVHTEYVEPVFFSLCMVQYLGKQTPRVVKEKIMALLFSWKVGLPTEGKIAEAYEMLKKEGRQKSHQIVFKTRFFC